MLFILHYFTLILSHSKIFIVQYFVTLLLHYLTWINRTPHSIGIYNSHCMVYDINNLTIWSALNLSCICKIKRRYSKMRGVFNGSSLWDAGIYTIVLSYLGIYWINNHSGLWSSSNPIQNSIRITTNFLACNPVAQSNSKQLLKDVLCFHRLIYSYPYF